MSGVARFASRRGSKIGAEEPLQPGFISPRLTVPPHIQKPPYADTGLVSQPDPMVLIHSKEMVNRMRKAGNLARKMLDYACSLAQPGVSPDEVDKLVHQAIVEAGAYPSPLNYMGFPKSLCSSVNECICHGIPDDRPFRDGDIVSFDVSLFLNGVHGDNCGTVLIGEVDEQGQSLVQATQEAVNAGVAVCKPGACLSDIGSAIQDVSEKYKFESVKKYCGHGIGQDFHIPPLVQHFRNQDRLPLKPGMIFTIEPMFVEGSQESAIWQDGWTVVTVDGGRAAQFEHTILITEDGNEILTVNPENQC